MTFLWKTLVPCLAAGWLFSNADSVPKPEVGGRVVDLLNGEHFDDILMDTPDELRPGSLVLFFRSQDQACKKAFDDMEYRTAAETHFPPRERVMIGKYDMDMHDKRLHTEFSPEQDLPKRFGLDGSTTCPILVYVPQKCNGHTEWCTETIGDGIEVVGCEEFTDQCTDWRVWDGEGEWKAWANEQIESEPYPPLDMAFGDYDRQGGWIKGRDRVTTNTHMRNNFLAPSLPKFSDTGTKLLKIPDELYKELTDFYYQNVPRRSNEQWDIYGATQMNFHEVGTDLVYLDLDPFKRDELANRYIRPILEEWSGEKLKLNAFYGIREYFPGAWLRNHVDRIDTHIISATLSVLKPNATEAWPLETVDWSGKRLRYEHKAGEMLLYESSTRPHGRPYKLKDGMHVGCFVHFSPLDEGKFRKQLGDGRRMLSGNYTTVPYRSTPSDAPKNPRRVSVIVTPENMASKTKDRRARAHSTGGSKRKSRNKDGQLGVDFVNDVDNDLVLYWVSFEGEPMKNA